MWQPTPGLQLGRDRPQPDEPHAQGTGACPAAAQGDPVHAVPSSTPGCHHLELSRQLSCLYCNPSGQPACHLPLPALALVHTATTLLRVLALGPRSNVPVQKNVLHYCDTSFSQGLLALYRLRQWAMGAWLPRSWLSTPKRSTAPACQSLSLKLAD